MLQENHKKLLVIVGPNASGKSDLAVYLAKKFDGEVVSADSRQIYKYMDIGTGKITKKEAQGIPHYLLDIRHPSRQLTAAEYKKKAEKAIADIQKRGKLPILVGGTGFYIDAVVYDVDFPEVPPNKKLRNMLRNKSAEELFEMLKKKDPRRAAAVQKEDKRRIIRALEIIEARGSVPEIKNKISPYDALLVGVNIPKEELHERIQKRLEARLRRGMVKEVKELREKYSVSWKRLENLGLEYKWIALFLQKKINKQDMKENLLRDIKRYSRRQMSWFKRDKNINWLESPKIREKAEKKVEKWLK